MLVGEAYTVSLFDTMPADPTKVLLVDDDPAMLRLLAKWLEAEGYQVLRAGATGSILRRSSKVPLDLGQIARECVELARTRFHLGPEALEYVAHTQRATVLGDSEELKAAVWNLLDNAVKYSQDDVKIRVELDELHNNKVAVRVTDNGVGISPAELKRIFKRFYRIPASVAVRTKGSGLGLFIVRSVAKKHGGKAFAESAGQGQGSTFTLQLPAAPASA